MTISQCLVLAHLQRTCVALFYCLPHRNTHVLRLPKSRALYGAVFHTNCVRHSRPQGHIEDDLLELVLGPTPCRAAASRRRTFHEAILACYVQTRSQCCNVLEQPKHVVSRPRFNGASQARNGDLLERLPLRRTAQRVLPCCAASSVHTAVRLVWAPN